MAIVRTPSYSSFVRISSNSTLTAIRIYEHKGGNSRRPPLKQTQRTKSPSPPPKCLLNHHRVSLSVCCTLIPTTLTVNSQNPQEQREAKSSCRGAAHQTDEGELGRGRKRDRSGPNREQLKGSLKYKGTEHGKRGGRASVDGEDAGGGHKRYGLY
jgi:hypothetical protein